VWADTLFRAEQQHAIGLLLWSAISILSGTGLLVIFAAKRASSPLLRHFALQMICWGAAIALLGAISWRTVAMRDLASATRLERTMLVALGLEIGAVTVGVTLATATWVVARRMGGVGAGIGIAVQGLALFVLDARLVSLLSL
jgi:hypothetical protein